MKHRMVTFSFLIIIFSNFVLLNTAYGGTYSGFTTIERLSPSGGGVFIKLANGNHNTELCGNTDWVYLTTTVSNYSVIISIALSAFTTNTEVTVYSDGCVGTYGKVTSLEVKK